MIKQNMQDERVVAQRRKMYSEGFGILMIVLMASAIVKSFFLHAPFEQFAVELISFAGMAFYIVIRSLTLGLSINKEVKSPTRSALVNSLVVGAVVAAINGVLNYSQYSELYAQDGIGYFAALLAVTFISATALSFAVLAIVGSVNKANQTVINNALNAEDEDE